MVPWRFGDVGLREKRDADADGTCLWREGDALPRQVKSVLLDMGLSELLRVRQSKEVEHTELPSIVRDQIRKLS